MSITGNITRIRELIEYSCDEAGCPELANNIRVEWSNRFTRRLGDANYLSSKQIGRVRFSTKLWPSMSEEKQDDLVLHETAHVISFYKKGKENVLAEGRGGHGPTWGKIAKQIGAEPERYAKSTDAAFAEHRRRVTRYKLSCSGCGRKHTISKTKLTRMRNATSKNKNVYWFCKTCSCRFILNEKYIQEI